MTMWEMLGIEPTKDIAVIKKAYAARARECHPEEYPEEYQRLRSAYKWAIQYAKRTSASGLPPGVFPGPPQAEPKPGAAEQPESEPGPLPPKPQLPRPKPEPSRPKTEPPKPQPESEEPEQKLHFEMPEEPEPEVHMTEEPKPENENFSYEEVYDYPLPEVVDQFYLEFEYIQKNPYLINNPEIWRCLCDRSDWKKLFLHERFRQELIVRLCSLPLMRMKTFIFWDELLAKYDEGIRQQKEWTRKRRICARENYFSRAEHKATREEYDLHAKMLAYLRRNKIDAGLKTRESVEAYLNYYIPYMDRYWNEMRRAHRGKKERRHKPLNWKGIIQTALLTIGLGVFLGVAIVFTCYFFLPLNEEDPLDNELRIQNDIRFEKDYISRREQVIVQTLKLYESWLEEEKSTEGY